MRITIESGLAEKFGQNMTILENQLSKAIAKTADQVANMIQEQGRQDIASAGRFGAAWQTPFFTKVNKTDDGAEVAVYNSNPLWGVFEFGATIQGTPYLWLPLNGIDVKAKNYGGGLVFVARVAGAPILFSIRDKRPAYIGLTSVTIPQKFHLRDIINRVAKQIPTMLQANMKA